MSAGSDMAKLSIAKNVYINYNGFRRSSVEFYTLEMYGESNTIKPHDLFACISDVVTLAFADSPTVQECYNEQSAVIRIWFKKNEKTFQIKIEMYWTCWFTVYFKILSPHSTFITTNVIFNRHQQYQRIEPN